MIKDLHAVPYRVLRLLLNAGHVRRNPNQAQRIRAEINRREKEGRW